MKRSPSIVASHESGFTLIEILAASVAAAVILVAIYGLFQRAVKMRDHATERTHDSQLRARAEKVIRNDLRNAFISGGVLAATMEGGKQSQKSRFPGYLHFTNTTGKEMPAEPYGDVQEVTYYISDAPITSESNGNSNRQDAGTLTRSITRDLLSPIRTTTRDESLLTRVESMEVDFFDGQTWQESWQVSATNPTRPQAIRVRIQQAARSDETAAPLLLEILEPFTTEPLISSTASTLSSVQ